MIPPLSGILGEPPLYRNAIPQETAKKSSTPFDNDDICVMFDCSQDNTPKHERDERWEPKLVALVFAW